MALFNFQRPDKVIMIEPSDFKGWFKFRPLEPKYSLTIGSTPRRVMLSSLEGFITTSVKFNRIKHELSTVSGVRGNITEIILSLKQTRFGRQVEDIEEETTIISVSGKRQLTAGDLWRTLSDLQILSPGLMICNMEATASFPTTVTTEEGRGRMSAEENAKPNVAIGVIATDSMFTPIKDVKYSIENYRVEQKTDYERLVFEMRTDGSIRPKLALTEAARTLIRHFMLFSDGRMTLEANEITQTDTCGEESLCMKRLLKTKLTNMGLSVRALNYLKAVEVETLGDLISFNRTSLMKSRSFGKKSLIELDELVASKDLISDTNISKYKLDKDWLALELF